MTTEFTHSVRNSLADREREFRLSDDALEWRAGGETKRVAYDQITLLRLIRYAGPGGDHRQLAIRTRNGERIKLRSHHYRSLGRFEDRSESFIAFVRQLFLRVNRANPEARFVAGSAGLRIAWLIVLALIGVLAVIIVAVSVEGEGSAAGIIAGVGLILGVIGLAWRSYRYSKPVTFDPHAPPVELL